MIISGWQNLVKFTQLISKEAENNKRYVKYVFWKVFKNLYEAIKESISSNAADLFLLEELLKGTWALKGHSKGTWVLEDLRHSKGT